MTINQIMECALGKACAMTGDFGDATPFTSDSVNAADKICEKLHACGYQRHGWETMYSGITGDIIEARIFMGPTYYQRLKHMVSEKMHCLSMDHEVLTIDGWKTFDELDMKDKIATLSTTGDLIYDYPTDLHYYPDHKGMMYHVVGQGIDLNVTEGHRMYVSEDDKNEFKFIEAKHVIGKKYVYKNINESIDTNDVIETFEYKKCAVFCVSVPSEVFYVRRNGKCIWTGNSRSKGHVTMMFRTPTEGAGTPMKESGTPKKRSMSLIHRGNCLSSVKNTASPIRRAIHPNCGNFLLGL